MRSPLLFVGIDGTGPDSDSTYQDAFRWSYVQALFKRVTAAWSFYHRGPTLAGVETKGYADTVAEVVRGVERLHQIRSGLPVPPMIQALVPAAGPGWLSTSNEAAPGPWRPIRICLAGYSRGGAAAVFAAKQLEKRKILIDYLVLFDAVDRAGNIPLTWTIPSNVKKTWHAMRDGRVASRQMFGHTAQGWDKVRTQHVDERFETTHGGMGGTPWCTDPAYRKKFVSKSGLPSPTWQEQVVEIDQGTAEYALVAATIMAATSAIGLRSQTGVALKRACSATITYNEDYFGSELVWSWMSRKLANEGLIKDVSWPLRGVKERLALGTL